MPLFPLGVETNIIFGFFAFVIGCITIGHSNCPSDVVSGRYAASSITKRPDIVCPLMAVGFIAVKNCKNEPFIRDMVRSVLFFLAISCVCESRFTISLNTFLPCANDGDIYAQFVFDFTSVSIRSISHNVVLPLCLLKLRTSSLTSSLWKRSYASFCFEVRFILNFRFISIFLFQTE